MGVGLVVVATVLAGCGAAAAESDTTKIESVGTITVDAELARAVPEKVKASGLRVVTSAPYPPWEMINNGVLEGVDIDIAHAIGARLGLKVTVESVDFQGLVPAVQAGKYDVAMAGMGDSKERQRVFDFVDYAQSGGVYVIRKGNPEGLRTFTDLCGKVVGFEQGSTQSQAIENRQSLCTDAGKPKVRLAPYPSSSITLALRSGKISAYPTNLSNALPLVKAQGNVFELLRDPEAPSGYPEKPGGQIPYTGIAVSKGVAHLADSIYAAMVSLGKDGTTKKIFEKWGIGDVAVVPPLRNQANY
ncbi:ABC transporter substrate-binding protein [Kribbella solani]